MPPQCPVVGHKMVAQAPVVFPEPLAAAAAVPSMDMVVTAVWPQRMPEVGVVTGRTAEPAAHL